MAQKVTVHKIEDPDEIKGYALKFGESKVGAGFPTCDDWIIYCKHPEDIVPHLATLIPGIDISQIPHSVKDPESEDRMYSDEGNAVGNPVVNVIFIWHGHGGLSAIAWHSMVREITSRKDFKIIDMFCSGTFC